MKNSIKKILCGAALVACLAPAFTPVNVFAAGKITDSYCEAVCVETNYRWYAKGYTTSKTRYYTSVWLINGALGAITEQSDRKWGTGKVSNKTKTCNTLIACNNYYARVYYGFSN